MTDEGQIYDTIYYMDNRKNILTNAKMLRKNMTTQEKKLWYYLRNNSFYGLKFRRQVPIGTYIVDFVCENKKIIIQLDGGQHNENKNIEYDNERTKFLESKRYKVLRFWNNDIDNNLISVLEKIKDIVNL